MFMLRKSYLTPKGRLSGKDLAFVEHASVSTVYDGGVVIQVEGPDGEVYKLTMSQRDAADLVMAINVTRSALPGHDARPLVETIKVPISA